MLLIHTASTIPKPLYSKRHCLKRTSSNNLSSSSTRFTRKQNFTSDHPRQADSFYINPYPNKPRFLRVCSGSLLKTLWEKKKLLVTSNFSFFQSIFYHFGKLLSIFIKFEIVVCKLFQFGRV